MLALIIIAECGNDNHPKHLTRNDCLLSAGLGYQIPADHQCLGFTHNVRQFIKLTVSPLLILRAEACC